MGQLPRPGLQAILLTLQGAWLLVPAFKHSMLSMRAPFQKRLLLHVWVSSTRRSNSCSALAWGPPWRVIPQPAVLHQVPSAGLDRGFLGRASGLTFLLGCTRLSSCGDRRTSKWQIEARLQRQALRYPTTSHPHLKQCQVVLIFVVVARVFNGFPDVEGDARILGIMEVVQAEYQLQVL